MDLRKELNSKNYAIKKHHERYDKRHKLAKEERKQDLLEFEHMTAEELLKFIEDKYEGLDKKMISLSKTNNSIKARIEELIKGYNKEQIMKKCRFLARSENINLTP